MIKIDECTDERVVYILRWTECQVLIKEFWKELIYFKQSTRACVFNSKWSLIHQEYSCMVWTEIYYPPQNL